jgi:hypothetical protein
VLQIHSSILHRRDTGCPVDIYCDDTILKSRSVHKYWGDIQTARCAIVLQTLDITQSSIDHTLRKQWFISFNFSTYTFCNPCLSTTSRSFSLAKLCPNQGVRLYKATFSSLTALSFGARPLRTTGRDLVYAGVEFSKYLNHVRCHGACLSQQQQTRTLLHHVAIRKRSQQSGQKKVRLNVAWQTLQVLRLLILM